MGPWHQLSLIMWSENHWVTKPCAELAGIHIIIESCPKWHKEEHCLGSRRDDWMNKAGIGTPCYYLTSVDSVPKQ